MSSGRGILLRQIRELDRHVKAGAKAQREPDRLRLPARAPPRCSRRASGRRRPGFAHWSGSIDARGNRPATGGPAPASQSMAVYGTRVLRRLPSRDVRRQISAWPALGPLWAPNRENAFRCLPIQWPYSQGLREGERRDSNPRPPGPQPAEWGSHGRGSRVLERFACAWGRPTSSRLDPMNKPMGGLDTAAIAVSHATYFGLTTADLAAAAMREPACDRSSTECTTRATRAGSAASTPHASAMPTSGTAPRSPSAITGSPNTRFSTSRSQRFRSASIDG